MATKAVRGRPAQRGKSKPKPMSTTVRVSRETHDKLRALAKDTAKPLQDVLDVAVERYRRHRFLERASEAYARLRADPVAWAELERERALWESLDADLEDE